MDMVTVIPTKKDIGNLVSFLPKFSSKGYDPVVEWQVEKHPDDIVQISPPVYKQEVYDFVEMASKACWVDTEYLDHLKNLNIADPGAFESFEIAQIKTVLTYAIRGERFTSGHLASMFSSRVIQRLLHQLKKMQKILHP